MVRSAVIYSMCAGTILCVAHLDARYLQYWMVHLLRVLQGYGDAVGARLNGKCI